MKNLLGEKLDFSHKANEPRRVRSSASKWYVFLQLSDHFVSQTATRCVREAQLQHLIRDLSLIKADPYPEYIHQPDLYYGKHNWTFEISTVRMPDISGIIITVVIRGLGGSIISINNGSTPVAFIDNS